MARILIVDDEDGLRRVMVRHFVRCGHTVRDVADYSAVREEIDARDYDIAFLDVCMPGMNGGDVCYALQFNKRLNAREEMSLPPIVMMTGYPDLVNLEFVRRHGSQIYCCLVKPFTLAEADEVLQCCLTQEILEPAVDLVLAGGERPAHVA